MNRYQCKAGKGNLHSPEEGQGAGLKRLRNWVRQYDDIYVVQGKDFVQPFRFSVAPDTAHWPHIKIEEARGLPSDLSACAYEIRLEIDTQGAPEFWIEAGGQRFRWLKEGGVLSCGEDSIPVAQGAQGISLRLVLDRGSIEVFTPGSDCVLAVEGKEGPGEAIAFSVPRHSIHIRRMTIYGLRSIFDDSGSAQERPGGKLLYESRSYSIYSDGVADRVYGEPHAIVPNRDTILSPQRVTETFSWGYPYLDMTRVVDREDEWHPNPGIGRFLDIHTGHDVFDAACRVALDIFFRCSSGEFSLKGQEGMWQGGFFQGAGMGFGVWVRDTAHIAMRAGNLIDPQVAKRSLRYTVDAGFDNAADGTAMPIIGIYDYVLATGDTGLATEAWPQLVRRMEQLEASFDKDACLIPAPQSTSNDAFEEPENGGYALSTEICFMLACRAMSGLADLSGEANSASKRWGELYELLHAKIKTAYWNEAYGYFTSGPIGSIAYQNGYWETSGQDLAVWPRLGIAGQEQRKSILRKLPEVAMNEFGVDLFPYKEEKNHYCGASWPVWTVGIAAVANAEGDLDLVTKLIAQQTRHAIVHKTFYESMEMDTGMAWRWPGQLWHAAAYISYYLYGILGMTYDAKGLYFHPAVPELFQNLSVENFVYRRACLTIKIKGWGEHWNMLLDGEKADYIPADIAGAHEVQFVCSKEMK